MIIKTYVDELTLTKRGSESRLWLLV